MKAHVLYPAARINRIVKDLLRKTPRARDGDDSAGMECETSWEWCDRYSKTRDLWVCNKTYWGYTREQILKCGIYSRSTAERAIRRQAEAEGKELSGAAINRRANRIEDRVLRMIERDKRRGDLAGIYEVVYGWETIGAVAATDRNHAMQLAVVTYGALCEDHSRIRLNWEGLISRELLVQTINNASRGDFDARIEDIRMRAEAKVAEIEKERERFSYVTLIGLDLAETIEEQG